MKRMAVFTMVVLLILGLAPLPALSSGDSIVVGRIIGTFQELPGYFYKNPDVLSAGVHEIEFTGFRLVRAGDGKKFLIRPNQRGFFYQRLPAGKYNLVRKRSDKPDYKEPGSIDIMDFKVGPATLVNLGTIRIVLEGKPHESLRSLRNSTKGTYTYRYSYEREYGEQAYDAVKNWFTSRKPSVAAEYGNSKVMADAEPTSQSDGSRKVLRLVVPRSER